MKVKTLSKLYLVNGTELKAPATFREAVVNALGASDSKTLTPAKQLRLALKIETQEEVELDKEEINAIDAACGAVFAPIVSGQVSTIMTDGVSVYAPK